MSTTTELKPLPCPFCGSEPEITTWGADTRTGAPFHQIECGECGCSIGYSSEPLATHIDNWNTRRTAAHGEPSKEDRPTSEYVSAAAKEMQKFMLQERFQTRNWHPLGEDLSQDATDLAYALDLLTEAVALLLNLADRVKGQAGSVEQVSEKPVCHDCCISPNGKHEVTCPEYAAQMDGKQVSERNHE